MNNSQKENSEENKSQSLFSRIYSKKTTSIIIGALGGAVVGWLYWEFIGCNGGSCPLTSNQYKTVGVFTLMGAWFIYRK